MSKKLEAMLDGLSPAQTAAMMAAVNQIASYARDEGLGDVPLDDIAGLVQVKHAVFSGGELDSADLANAVYNLRASSAAVIREEARADALREAKEAGADPDADRLDGGTLMGISNPHLRLKLARKHGIGIPAEEKRGDRRPAHQPQAVPGMDDGGDLPSGDEAIRRLAAARRGAGG